MGYPDLVLSFQNVRRSLTNTEKIHKLHSRKFERTRKVVEIDDRREIRWFAAAMVFRLHRQVRDQAKGQNLYLQEKAVDFQPSTTIESLAEFQRRKVNKISSSLTSFQLFFFSLGG